MICLRRIFPLSPTRIINVHHFESKRTISLFRNIFNSRTRIRVPLEFDIKEYKVIYSFQLASTFCRLLRRKYILYGASFLTIFGSIGCLRLGYINNTEYYFFTTVGILNIIIMTLIMGLARNVVGRIYVKNDRSKVVISYGNSVGNRVNKVFDPVNLVIEDHPSLIYRRFCKRLTLKETEFHCNLCNFQMIKDELQFGTLFRKYM